MIKIAIFNGTQNINTSELINSIEKLDMQPILIVNSEEFDFAEFDAYFFLHDFEDKDILKTIKFESTKGKPVIGIKYGAKVLIDNNFISEIKDKVVVEERPEANALLPDETHDSINIVNISINRNSFNVCIDEEEMLVMHMPNASTRFYFKENKTKRLLKENDQIIFMYCDEDGFAEEEIAGIINKKGNVLALMPLLKPIDIEDETDTVRLLLDSIKIHIEELNDKD